MNITAALKKVIGATRHSWADIPGVEITIPGRGESIIYRENGRHYEFEICCIRQPLELFGGSYWDGVLPATRKRLSDEERTRIIPRLVAYLGCKGETVEVRDE